MSYFLNGGLGVKFYLREGDYVLRSQPISSPPVPLPLPIYAGNPSSSHLYKLLQAKKLSEKFTHRFLYRAAELKGRVSLVQCQVIVPLVSHGKWIS